VNRCLASSRARNTENSQVENAQPQAYEDLSLGDGENRQYGGLNNYLDFSAPAARSTNAQPQAYEELSLGENRQYAGLDNNYLEVIAPAARSTNASTQRF